MNWTEPKPPTEGVSYYDHVILRTPFGNFMIEWKGWKESPSYDIMFNNEYVGSECDLNDAKERSVEYLKQKYDELGKMFL
jgi:hypothetical protein